ncbi:MAG: hypothetical protein L3J30_13155 [Marinosulfonomonas sp.]|nr:hypothetical protein [Marinosulfonomonas sp.]
MSIEIIQVWILPGLIGLSHPMIWVVASGCGLLIGTTIGALQGYLVAYLGIPAFIVTLGGLFVWRGASFLLARGETISPVDTTFSLLDGGPYGAVGSTVSWGHWLNRLSGCYCNIVSGPPPTPTQAL